MQLVQLARAEDPTGPTLPLGHAEQDEAPAAAAYLPAVHGVQEVAEVEGENDPTEQKVHDVDPAEPAYVPAAQGVQELEPAAADEPAAHCVQMDALGPDTDPPAQVMHAVPPVLYFPAVHAVHVLAPEREDVPAEQGVHAEPAAE